MLRTAAMRKTIVMGCAAALDDGAIAALPGVRAVVPNADPSMVLRAAGVDDVGAQHAAPYQVAPNPVRY